MDKKGNYKLLTAGLLLSLLIFGPLNTGATEGRLSSAHCGADEAVTFIFFRTAAQLEPVGSMTVSSCAASTSSTAWGTESPFYAVSCQPERTCE